MTKWLFTKLLGPMNSNTANCKSRNLKHSLCNGKQALGALENANFGSLIHNVGGLVAWANNRCIHFIGIMKSRKSPSVLAFETSNGFVRRMSGAPHLLAPSMTRCFLRKAPTSSHLISSQPAHKLPKTSSLRQHWTPI